MLTIFIRQYAARGISREIGLGIGLLMTGLVGSGCQAPSGDVASSNSKSGSHESVVEMPNNSPFRLSETDTTSVYLYATNNQANTVTVYGWDNVSNTVTTIQSITTPSQPGSIAFDNDRRWGFIAETDGSLVSYLINAANGHLIRTASVIHADIARPAGIAVHPTGNWVFATDWGSSRVGSYRVDRNTGSLSAGSSASTARSPVNVAVSPDGRFVFVVSYNGSKIDSYSFNSTTGALTSVGVVSSAANWQGASWVVVEPNGKNLFVSNQNGGTVSTFSISSTGTLTQTANASVPGGPDFLAVDLQSTFVFSTNQGSGTVVSMRYNPVAQDLTVVDSKYSGTHAGGFALEPSGRFGFSANYSDNSISAWEINRSTGALTPLLTFPSPSHPNFLSIIRINRGGGNPFPGPILGS